MKVLLTHTGTKRGGWNVQWWLETRRWLEGFVPPEEAVRLGFEPRRGSHPFSPFYHPPVNMAVMGPFPTREEAEARARELGLEPVTPQRLARMRKVEERGPDDRGVC